MYEFSESWSEFAYFTGLDSGSFNFCNFFLASSNIFWRTSLSEDDSSSAMDGTRESCS